MSDDDNKQRNREIARTRRTANRRRHPRQRLGDRGRRDHRRDRWSTIALGAGCSRCSIVASGHRARRPQLPDRGLVVARLAQDLVAVLADAGRTSRRDLLAAVDPDRAVDRSAWCRSRTAPAPRSRSSAGRWEYRRGCRPRRTPGRCRRGSCAIRRGPWWQRSRRRS